MLERVLNLFNRVPHAESSSRPGALALDDVEGRHDLLAWASALPDEALAAEARASAIQGSIPLEGRRWAILADAARRSCGYLPSDEQIVAARTMATGGVARLAPGEDCGLVVGLAAAETCLLGHLVHILETDAARASAMREALAPLFSLLGIPLIASDDDASSTEGTVGAALVCAPGHVARHLAGDWWERSLGWPAFGGGAVGLLPEAAIDAAPEPATRIRVGLRDPIAVDVVERAGFVADRLKEGSDFKIDRRLGIATLTERGISAVERRMNLDKPADERFAQFVHQLGQAMLAGAAYRRDREYAVLDGDVVPVDATTSLPLRGRRFRRGLHEALQRKEGLPIRSVAPLSASLTPGSLLGSYARVGTVRIAEWTGDADAPAQHGRELSAWSHTGASGKYLSMSVEIEAAAAERRPVLGVFGHADGAEQVAALLRERSVACEVLDSSHEAGSAVVRATRFEAPPILWVCPEHPRLGRAPCTPPPALIERLQDLLIVAETLPSSAETVLPTLAAPLGRVASYRRHIVPGDELAGDGGDADPSRVSWLLDAALAAIQAHHFRSFAALRRDTAIEADVVERALALAAPELDALLDAFLPDDNAERWDRAGLLRVLGQYVPKATLPDLRPLRRMRRAERIESVRAQTRSSWRRIVANDAASGRASQVRDLLRSIVESASQRLTGSLEDLAKSMVRLAPALEAGDGGHTGESWRRVAATYEAEAAILERDARREIGQETLASLGQLVAELDMPAAQAPTVRRDQPKVGRNDLCPCGSGKKFKRCCGALPARHA